MKRLKKYPKQSRLYLDNELANRLDRLMMQKQLPKAELIRRALNQYCDSELKQA